MQFWPIFGIFHRLRLAEKIRQTIFDSFPNPLGWLLLLFIAFVKRVLLLAFSSGLDVRQMSTQEKRATAERFQLLRKHFAALNLISLGGNIDKVQEFM